MDIYTTVMNELPQNRRQDIVQSEVRTRRFVRWSSGLQGLVNTCSLKSTSRLEYVS